MPLCDRLEIVGSIRRQKPVVGDVDYVVVAADGYWNKIAQILKKSTAICTRKSVTKLICPFGGCLFQVDFYRATSKTFVIQESIRTGSADHNIWPAVHVVSKGFRLKYSEGLTKDDTPLAGETEEVVFSALGLPCPKPKMREIVEQKPFGFSRERILDRVPETTKIDFARAIKIPSI